MQAIVQVIDNRSYGMTPKLKDRLTEDVHVYLWAKEQERVFVLVFRRIEGSALFQS